METPDGRGARGAYSGRSCRLKIAVLYDGGADDWTTEDIQSVLEPVWAVSRVLTVAGHQVTRVQVRPDLVWLDAVRKADLVFNLCEGIGGISHLEYTVASAIELCGIPYTGAKAWTMTVCHRKPLLNALLHAEGIPVPVWRAVEGRRGKEIDVPLPAMVKPAAEDASVGIEQESVVTSPEALRERVRYLATQFSEIIVQRYIHGREIAVAFVGDRTLPLSEIDFGAMPEGAWPILSFQAKWTPGSPEDLGSRPICPANLNADLAERVRLVAVAAWRAVRGSGYGRVDLRVDADGRPWVIEVNPNPDISTDAGLARMAAASGWSYRDLVLQILDDTLAEPTPSRLRALVQLAGRGGPRAAAGGAAT